MITEDYVSFETAKLLKKKGFDWKCEYCYDVANDDPYSNANYQVSYSKPTLQMAMKWLRKVHNLHIEVHYNTFWDYYQYTIFYYDGKIESDMAYHSFENAAETAIKYCLKKLI